VDEPQTGRGRPRGEGGGPGPADGEVPWPQRVFDSVWMLALAAVVFFFLSYVVWGLIDLLSIRSGG